MIEKLKDWGFYAYSIKTAKPFVGRIIYRKNDFGFGWELDLPYTSIPPHLLGGHSELKALTTLHKVIGDKRELVFKFPGKIPDEILEQFILNSI